jgi:hypothetical protein
MMTSIVVVGGIMLGAAAVGIGLLVRWAHRAPDLAWRSTGVRFTTGRDYLQAQGIANSLEARKQTARGRRYQPSAGPAAGADAVVATPRRLAEVVPLRRRQA